MAELIQRTDDLNTGREKLNNAILDAEDAKQKSDHAVNVSEQAKQIAQTAENKADNVQEQFNQVVIEGDSSVEAAQARVTADGKVFNTLRDRLNSTDEQLAQTANRVGVTYEQFGAKLDGVTDDTEAIRAAHNYANEHGFPVVQKNSVFVLNGEVEVKTDLDLSGSTVITNWNDDEDIEYNRNNILYRVTGMDSQDITDMVDQSEFEKGATFINGFKNVKSGSITIKTNEVDMYRNDDGTIRTVLMNEPNVIINDNTGDLLYPITMDFKNANNFRVIWKPFEKRITIKLPNLILDNANIRTFVQIERNNVDVYGGSISEINTSPVIGSIYDMIHIKECHDVTLNNVNCPHIGRERYEQYGRGYPVTLRMASKISIERFTQKSGWGGIDGNWYRDLYVNNSHVIGVNAHVRGYDVTVKNTTLESGVNFHGGGVLHIENVIHTGSRSDVVISTRLDYAGEFDGVIRVKNLITYKAMYIIHLQGVNYDCGRKVILPNIDVDNITIQNPYYRRVYLLTWRGFNGDYEVQLPSHIHIKNVYVHEPLTSFKTIYMPNDLINDEANGEVDIVINNVKIPFSFLTDTSNLENTTIDIPKTSDNIKLNIELYKTLVNLRVNGTSNINVDIDNCDVVGIRRNNDSYITEHGEPLKLYHKNCTIYRWFTNVNAVGRILVTVEDSKYVPWVRPHNQIVDNEVAPNINQMVIYSRNNVAEHGMDVSKTSFRMFNWIDPNYWVTVDQP